MLSPAQKNSAKSPPPTCMDERTQLNALHHLTNYQPTTRYVSETSEILSDLGAGKTLLRF